MNDKKEALANIVARYQEAGFTKAEVTCPSGVVFRNAFSIQAVFVIEGGYTLKEQWTKLHEELIDAYRSYEGFVDIEWNFYCVFVVLESDVSDDFGKTRRMIENDTLYSRKFVFLGNELDFLPPGRIETAHGESSSPEYNDSMAVWREVLGDEMLQRIDAATFAELKDVLEALVREEGKRSD